MTMRSAIAGIMGATPFAPVTNTYNSGSGTETAPYGAASCVITIWGGGGGGGITSGASAFGAGGGGKSVKTW